MQTNEGMQANPLTVLDLFCGCGGLTTGLENAGLSVLAGIDIWKTAVDSYRKNHDHLAVCADLQELSPETFERDYGIDKVDIVVGGPPCQGFSMAGKRDKNDPRNSLFMEYVKYLNYYKPRVFVFENVMGILSMKMKNGEKAIDVIMSYLNANYRCCINRLYASDFQVPQNRRRVIIIGVRRDLNIEPEPIEPVISDRIPVSTVLLNKDDVSPSYFLSERAINGINRKRDRMKKKSYGFGAQFLKMDKPSYTIPARYWKDGYDALVKYSDAEIRRLTILELKRIQTFPDDYALEGSKKDQIIQIGNAVPCKLGFHIGRYLKQIFSR